MPLTHFNEEGRAHMVDVSHKAVTHRTAIAKGSIRMQSSTIALIQEKGIKKGDVLSVAQVAGIMGAKQTSQWIPMCHPLLLTGVNISFSIEPNRILIQAEVKTEGQTGVEMEALTAVSVTALTIYDMCKAVDKDMTIENIELIKKTGGKSDYFKGTGGTL